MTVMNLIIKTCMARYGYKKPDGNENMMIKRLYTNRNKKEIWNKG